MKCPYCNALAHKVTGKVIYPHRRDLHAKWFYVCHPCDAYVGCHPGTDKPLGRLANAELRKAKNAAHAAFDPLWRQGMMKRRDAYCWLAGKLGIPSEECHIGMMDVAACKKVIDICTSNFQEAKNGL